MAARHVLDKSLQSLIAVLFIKTTREVSAGEVERYQEDN